MAIRGTDDLRDVLTDAIDIGIIGSTTQQAQYISLRTKVTEWINNGILPQTFTVTGHSLGGFLATGIAADFYQLSRIPDPGHFSHIKAAAEMSPVAGSAQQISSPINILIENH